MGAECPAHLHRRRPDPTLDPALRRAVSRDSGGMVAPSGSRRSGPPVAGPRPPDRVGTAGPAAPRRSRTETRVADVMSFVRSATPPTESRRPSCARAPAPVPPPPDNCEENGDRRPHHHRGPLRPRCVPAPRSQRCAGDVPGVRTPRVRGRAPGARSPRSGRGGCPADVRPRVAGGRPLRRRSRPGVVARDDREAHCDRHLPPRGTPAGRARSPTSPPTTRRWSRLPPDLDTLDAVWHVRQAIDALPPDEATIVRLQHLDGMTHSEISEQLGIALGTVKSRSHRAHRKLAALLGHLRERAP